MACVGRPGMSAGRPAMNRVWILVAGMVLAVPLGVFMAGEMDVLSFQPEVEPGQSADEAVEVVHVIDGDTIIVDRGGQEERVRILGIDAPEVARDGEPGRRARSRPPHSRKS